MERLVHKPTGELVADNPWSVPGTRVALIRSLGHRAGGSQGTITERCVELTKKLSPSYKDNQYVLWDSQPRGYGPTHIERSRLKIIS